MPYIPHLLQSPEWAKFRSHWGTKVVIVGKAQFTVHPIPFLPWAVGYMPRVFPKDIDWSLLQAKVKQNKCLFVKIEPNSDTFKPPRKFDVRHAERIFAYATYIIDLHKSEAELLAAMHPKTRYNIRLAQRKGVKIKVGHTSKMLDEFLTLFHETAKRQKIFNHPDRYYRVLFEIFKKDNKIEIVTGYFNSQPLASMIILFYQKNAFYPYGGSTSKHREKMASHLVYWEAIRMAKQRGCRYFDMWNCLLPNEEKPNHPWYGFHRFKKGFRGEQVKFSGAYDLVLAPGRYAVVLVLNRIRWMFLKSAVALKAVIKR